jgi:microsomal dipeptidase-like Zn-dependent dipeptidase
MIVDLHAHYPMHLIAQDTVERMTRFRRTPSPDWLKTLVLKVANQLANYEHGNPGVTIANFRTGNVGVALSVLYAPFSEMDLELPYGAPPAPSYFPDLIQQLELVEQDIAANYAGQAVVAHNRNELQIALAQGKVALVHCIEGGFHVGDTPATMRDHVRLLAQRGVAYITVAHLFWRHVAASAPAIPFLPDWLYRLLFPQPKEPLSELGRAMIEAMLEEHVLIDMTHMSDPATAATLNLLDQLDPAGEVPVFASHAAYEFGDREYNLKDKEIEAIARRKGVIGLIACPHYMAQGTSKPNPKTFEDSMDLICAHVDRIRQVTGSHDYTAFGSDHDGFIKPALPGLDSPARFAEVETRLVQKYGAAVAAQICSGNAMRVLSYWGG